MKVTGCDLLACALTGAGVRFVTGGEEGLLGPVFQYLKSEDGVTAITPAGDIAGGFMAYGNTFYENFPAVILASTPAEAVNSLAGVGTAWGDKIPVIIITTRADLSSSECLPGQTQGQCFSAFSKWGRVIERPEEIPRAVGQAFREAISGCPGSVHLDISEGALESEAKMSEDKLRKLKETIREELAVAPSEIEGCPELVEKALKVLLTAERPLILSGGGVNHAQAWDEMDRLVRLLEIPASTSMMGEGTVRGDNPCFIGGPSYVGGESFHLAIKKADCVLVVGASVGGFEGFGKFPLWNSHIRFIQVDIDPVNICLNIPAEISIIGDAGAVLRQMLELVESGKVKPNPAHKQWLEQLFEAQKRWRARAEREVRVNWPLIQPAYLAMKLKELIEPDSFVALDGGNCAFWASAFSLPHLPRSTFFPAGLGTLGCGIPVAMGIKAADPERPLVLIQGDGSFMYNVQELETARRLGMDFVIVIFNDGFWNMIKFAQDVVFGGRRTGSALGNIDYAAIARGFGCYGRRVEKAEDIGPAFKEARASGVPAILDVAVDPDTFPESFIGFLISEFDGVALNPLKMIGIPKLKIDVRLFNRIKFALNVILNSELK
ncbi:MAG: thiamine pyrophosphate-binding protein [Actinobacteria bacterium]|nr:thiamine pyrophosphate-binding protein [Actinomycetota bacterium]